MQLRPEIQLTSMIKAMQDVIIPALDPGNPLAQQQAQLLLGMLQLMQQQLPLQYRYDRDELQRLLRNTAALGPPPAEEPALAAAAAALGASRAAAGAALARCAGDPAELTAAVRELRRALGGLVEAAAAAADDSTYRRLQPAILELSREQLLRERSLLLMQGWEPDPASVPAIESLLDVPQE